MSRPIAALALSLVLPACLAAPLGAEEEYAAIVDGEATAGLDAVVAITPRRIGCGDEGEVLCSGTLIASNTILSNAADAVLSAAHCFDSMRPGLAYEVVVGEAIGPDSRAISVLEVRTHPDFDAETRQNDVAILWLERPAVGASPELLPDVGSAMPELGASVTLAGFGATSAGSAPDGLKRVGVGEMSEVRPGVVTVSPNPSVSCVGDSGGPLFTEAGELIGVASSGDTGCSETSVYALISPTIEEFIIPTLAMGPVERPLGGDSCGAPCTMDADCPAGFVCVPGSQNVEFQCALPGQEAGALGEACTEDSSCGAGFCALTETNSACQCYQPCDSEPPSSSSSGCAVRHWDEGMAPIWLLALLLWSGVRPSSYRPSRVRVISPQWIQNLHSKRGFRSWGERK